MRLYLWMQIEGATDDSVTYVIDKEDHTLGNALRHVIMRQYVCSGRKKQHGIVHVNAQR